MRILLVSANTESVNMRTLPWGMGCVAAAARRAGHAVRVCDLMNEEDHRAAINGAIAGGEPDVIGISVRNIDDQNRVAPTFFLDKIRDVVDVCRASSGAPVVLGGAGFSIFPRSALAYLGADMGIQGEGEEAFCALVDRLERGASLNDVPGLVLPGPGPTGGRSFRQRLDEFPLPDDDFLRACVGDDLGMWLPVQSRRGCAMDCSYCSTATIEGRSVRKRSPEAVIDWIARQATAGFGSFYFVDNNFNVPPDYARRMCRLLEQRGLDIRWRCILNPAWVDADLVSAMAAAGCTDVSLGFESGCARILAGMNKKFSVQDISRCAAVLAGHGIRRMGFLLLGGPGETPDTVEESLVYAASLGLEAMRVTTGIRIYPDTDLARVAVERGLIAPDDDLLRPRFYLEPGLEDRIDRLLAPWKSSHRRWIF